MSSALIATSIAAGWDTGGWLILTAALSARDKVREIERLSDDVVSTLLLEEIGTAGIDS